MGFPGKLRLITVKNALCTHRIIEYCSRPRRGNFWPRTGTFPRRVSADSGWWESSGLRTATCSVSVRRTWRWIVSSHLQKDKVKIMVDYFDSGGEKKRYFSSLFFSRVCAQHFYKLQCDNDIERKKKHLLQFYIKQFRELMFHAPK